MVLPVVTTAYRFWTKGYLEFNQELFFLLIVSISLANFGAGPSQYLAAINDLWAQTIITIARAAALFLAGYGLSFRFGIVSIGLSCVLAEMIASLFLPAYFVNKHLAKFSTRLAPMPMFLAAVPPALLIAVAILVLMQRVSFGLIALMMLPLLTITYYLNWRTLDADVKGRIVGLISSVTRKFSASL